MEKNGNVKSKKKWAARKRNVMNDAISVESTFKDDIVALQKWLL